MGATVSKRKKRKKDRYLEQSDCDTSPFQDLEKLRSLSKTRLNYLSAEIDRLPVSMTPFYSQDSLLSLETNSGCVPLNNNVPTASITFGPDHLNLDHHPVLTKLQNDQNTRLEHMERRINKIRTNAIQAADRRKYAHLFRAKPETSKTEQLLKEASEALEALKREKNRTLNNDECDKGDIIPVKVLCEEKPPITMDEKTTNLNRMQQFELWPAPLQSLSFNEPMMWLFLPFLLPLFFISLLIRSLTHSDRQKKQQ